MIYLVGRIPRFVLPLETARNLDHSVAGYFVVRKSGHLLASTHRLGLLGKKKLRRELDREIQAARAR